MAAAAAFTPAVQVHKGLDTVLSTVFRGQRCEGGELLKPNPEQCAFLRHFTARLQLEAGEQRAGKINIALAEPLLDCVHGPPGTGCSKYKPPRKIIVSVVRIYNSLVNPIRNLEKNLINDV